MSEKPTLPVTEANARLIAGLANADVRTARRFLEGETIKSKALRERLAAAVQEAEKRTDRVGGA